MQLKRSVFNTVRKLFRGKLSAINAPEFQSFSPTFVQLFTRGRMIIALNGLPEPAVLIQSPNVPSQETFSMENWKDAELGHMMHCDEHVTGYVT